MNRVRNLHLYNERSDKVVLEYLGNVGDHSRGRDVDSVIVREEHRRIVVDVSDDNVEQDGGGQRRATEVVTDQHHRVLAHRLAVERPRRHQLSTSHHQPGSICSGVARICCEERQRLKLCHGALTVDFRAGCSSCSMTNSFVTNAVLIERAVSC